jgi:uncharacterized protein
VSAHQAPIALSVAHRLLLCQLVHEVLPEARVAVFGSRVTGRSRPFSDLDLLLIEPAQLTWQQRVALQDALEASDLPFRTDIVEAASLGLDLRERIESEAQPL